MNKIDLTLFNWDAIQKRHDDGISFLDISKELNISRTALSRAVASGMFVKHDVKRKPIPEITKNKISKSLVNAHSEGRHTGWSHINSRQDKTSYPERFFIEVLKTNGIFDKYHIEQKLCIGKYFLDFAIIDLKLDIEIDGQQHFRDDDSINHDKIRNEYLIKNGWKIYRIAWVQMNANPKKEIDKFLKYIDNIDNEESHYYEISDIVIKRKPKFGTRLQYNNAKKLEYDKIQSQYIYIVLNSGIDFGKYGWVDKVSKIINQKPQKVNTWMKRFMLDHYENVCFKR